MLGFIGDVVNTLSGNMFADERQEDAQQFNSGEAALNRNFQRDMRATQYQTAVKDMQKAGLNPMLAYHQGGAGTPSGSAASSGTAGASFGHPPSASLQTAAQVDLLEASKDKTEAEAAEIRARTPTYAVNIDKMRQDMKQSEALIENLQQQTRTGAASARHLDQQIANLKEAIPQIRATVTQLKALANLNDQQAKEALAKTHLAGAQTAQSDATYDEIRQRIRANLPEIERGLKELELKASGLAIPGKAMDAAANASFLGAWRSALRALTGQSSQGK